jgi:hypothetical protein
MSMCSNRHRDGRADTWLHGRAQVQPLKHRRGGACGRTRIVMPRRIRDLALAAFGAALLIGALALIDQRVPREMAGVAREVSAGQWHGRGSAIDNLVSDIVGSPVANDMFLFAMVAAGVVLLILMLRT